MNNTLFEGMTVVELASVLAGPAVGTFFSELGARVIKVENKTTGGDVTRRWRQSGETEGGPSAYYASVNWDKESVFLDLSDPADRRTVGDYLHGADIVLANFKKGDAEKFGLAYENVRQLNPSIIYGRLTGFGRHSDRVAYDLIMQAEAGFMSMNGQPDGPPTRMPLALIDVLAAHQLKEGILCALLKQKDRPEQPWLVEVSLYDSAIASLVNQAANWLMNGEVPQRIGSLHPNIAPYGEVFTTRDRQTVTLAVGSDRQFKDLCAILDVPGLAESPRFCRNAKRVEYRNALAGRLRPRIAERESEPFLEQCRQRRVPAAKIKDLQQVFATPQARRLLLREDVEGRNTLRPQTTVFNLTS